MLHRILSVLKLSSCLALLRGSPDLQALTISEMLKAEGVCTQQRLITELVTRPLGEGKMSQKIRVEVGQ